MQLMEMKKRMKEQEEKKVGLYKAIQELRECQNIPADCISELEIAYSTDVADKVKLDIVFDLLEKALYSYGISDGEVNVAGVVLDNAIGLVCKMRIDHEK